MGWRSLLLKLRDRWGGLSVLALVWTVLPLALVLALVVGTGFYAYQRVVQSLLIARDQELAKVSAERLSDNIRGYADLLVALANSDEMRSGDTQRQGDVLSRSQDLLEVFDGGVAVLDERGVVTVTDPVHGELVGQNLAVHPYFQNTRALGQPTFSDIFQEIGSGEDAIVVAVPIISTEGDFRGVIRGGFDLREQIVSPQEIIRDDFSLSRRRLGQGIRNLKIGDEGYAYLVDRNGRVIYHPEGTPIGQDFSSRRAVDRLKHGEQVGAFISREPSKERFVIGFAILPATGWGLVIREPWAEVVAPVKSYLRLVALVLLAALTLAAFLISLGVRRISEPISDLVYQTRQVARGDYSVQVRLGNIREIRELGLAFNAMVERIGRYRAGVRRYVAAITHSQEEERKRIARDLHDDTVQSLIAIGQRIELCRASLDDPAEAREQLNDVRRMVTETIQSIRHFSRELRPLALEDLGLVPALQLLVNDLARADSLEADLEIEGQPQSLAPDLEVAIYRIVQEALQNVRKHADASKVSVLAEFTDKGVALAVRDDGIGFIVPSSPTDLASQGSFGLMGIEERAQLFGGELEIHSQPGHGTEIKVTLPLELNPPASDP
jgi:signal transduction histidine kinase